MNNTLHTLKIHVIATLYAFSKAGQSASVAKLAEELGLAPALVEEVLGRLDQAGWVDARRVRLTLVGLTLAVAATAPRHRSTFRAAA